MLKDQITDLNKMKILVCVKEVPDIDPEVELSIDSENAWIEIDDQSRFAMNRYDEYAVEEAIRIQEAMPDTTIDVVTVGPERSHMVIRRAMGMGADHGIHVITDHSGFISPNVVSSWLTQVAENRNYDLILTGVMSEDAQQGQTGVMLAERLSMPWATSVIKQEIIDESTIRVEREIEGGYRDRLEIKLPCVLTIQTGINQPRYPALSKVLKAKKAELEEISVQTLNNEQPDHHLMNATYPEKQREGLVIEGSSKEKAKQLLDLFAEKALI